MIVKCPNCSTKYNLDESKLAPEGSWVRCTKCSETFQATPPAAPPEPPPEEEEHGEQISLDLDEDSPGRENEGLEEDLDLEGLGGDFGLEEEPEAQGKGPGAFFRVLFWLIGIFLLLAVLAVGGVVVADRMGAGHPLLDKARDLPVIGSLMGEPQPGSGQGQGEILMALANVRGLFRLNNQAGRLFVIQGQVENQHPNVRMGILVRGRLQDAQGQVVRQAVVYAGPTFTPEEMERLSLEEIQARLAIPRGPDGVSYVVAPQGTIPFTVVFAELPGNLTEFSAEVVGSEPVPTGAPGR